MKTIIIHYLRKIRRIFRIIIGKEYFTLTDCKLGYENFGSEFGGWDIVVDDINKDSVVLSFGLGEDISFDTELIERFNLKVHGFDPTPKSIDWIESQDLSNNFILHKTGLADFNGTIDFNPPDDPSHVSHTILERSTTNSFSIKAPVKNISTIVSELGLDEIDIIKMDIEGAEYSVITDFVSTNVRPKQLLIEFHHRFPGVGVSKTADAVNEIRAMGYRLFCISPRGEEYSFIYDPSNNY